jgi:hypothetical protein
MKRLLVSLVLVALTMAGGLVTMPALRAQAHPAQSSKTINHAEIAWYPEDPYLVPFAYTVHVRATINQYYASPNTVVTYVGWGVDVPGGRNSYPEAMTAYAIDYLLTSKGGTITPTNKNVDNCVVNYGDTYYCGESWANPVCIGSGSRSAGTQAEDALMARALRYKAREAPPGFRIAWRA